MKDTILHLYSTATDPAPNFIVTQGTGH
jgi:hypothetical protein